MSYRVLYPIQTTFDATNLNEGLKKFIKLHYNPQMTNILLTKDELNYLSKVRYYTQKGLNKIGLNTYNISNNKLLDLLSKKSKSNNLILGNVPPHLQTSIPIINTNRMPIGPMPLRTMPLRPMPLGPLTVKQTVFEQNDGLVVNLLQPQIPVIIN